MTFQYLRELFRAASSRRRRRLAPCHRIDSLTVLHLQQIGQRLEDRCLLTEFWVNTLDDTPDTNPGDGVAVDANGNISLRAAVQEANALVGEDEINLSSGRYLLTIEGTGDDMAYFGDLDITESLTINGTTTSIVDGNGLDRIFHVTGSDVTLTLDGLIVTGGVADHGGGILNTGSLVVTDTIIDNNAATVEGGGIWNSGETSIRSSQIDNNTITGNGGDGGGVFSYVGSTVTVDRTSFRNNQAGNGVNSGGNGGAISIIGGVRLGISESLFTGNRAGNGGTTGGSGGAVYVHNTDLEINTWIHDGASSFRNNVAGSGDGGALRGGNGGAISFTNAGAGATSASIFRTEIAGNSAPIGGVGGGIYADESTVLTTVSINDNTAPEGGGVFLAGTGAAHEILYSTISYNTSTGRGGAGVFVYDGVSQISGTTIMRNSAINDGDGGGILVTGKVQLIQNSTIYDNRAAHGGGLKINADVGRIEHVTIAGNQATGNGGGIYLTDYVVGVDPVIGEFANTIVADNIGSNSDFFQGGGLEVAEHNLIESLSGHSIVDGHNGNITGVDPELQPLRLLDSATAILNLSKSSPAIDAGRDTTPISYLDQRGSLNLRIADGNRDGVAIADIGAIEFYAPATRLDAPQIASGETYDMKITPDGSQIVYSTAQGLFSSPIDGGDSVQITPSAHLPGSNRFVLSPDSRFVLYIVRSSYFVAAIDGSGVVAVIKNNPVDAQFAPDSASVIFYHSTRFGLGTYSLFKAPLNAAPMFPLHSDGVHPRRIYRMTIPPEGEHALYLGAQSDDPNPALYSVPLDGGSSRRLSNVTNSLGNPMRIGSQYRISPDGNYVVYQDSSTQELYSVSIADGVSVKLTDRIGGAAHLYDDYIITSDSRHVVYRTDTDSSGLLSVHVFKVPLTGGPSVQLDSAEFRGGVDSFQLTADSQYLVYLAPNGVGQARALYSAPLVGGIAIELSSGLSLNDKTEFAISPDGSHVVYLAPIGEGNYSSRLIDGAQTQLDSSATGGAVISPDSTYVVYQSNFGLNIIPIFGGQSRRLSHERTATTTITPDFLFSPDSANVIFRSDIERDQKLEIYRVRIDGGTAEKLHPELNPGNGVDFFSFRSNENVDYWANHDEEGGAWYTASIDGTGKTKLNDVLGMTVFTSYTTLGGQAFVFIASQGASDEHYLYKLDTVENSITRLSDDTVPIGSLSETADGSHIVLRSGTSFSFMSVPISGGPVTVIGSANFGSHGQDWKVSPDGKHLVYVNFQLSTQSHALFSVSAGSDQHVMLSNTPRDIFSVTEYAITPDSERVIFKDVEARAGSRPNGHDFRAELYSVPITGGEIQKVNHTLEHFGDVNRFKVSPDGQHIIYTADNNARQWGLFVVPIDGGVHSQISSQPFRFGFAVTANGQQLVYGMHVNGQNNLYASPLSGGTEVLLVENVGTLSQFEISSDDQNVIFTNGHIYRVSIHDGTVTALTSGLPFETSEFRLAQDGSQVFFTHDDHIFAASTTRDLVSIVDNFRYDIDRDRVTYPQIDFSPDGRTIAYAAFGDGDNFAKLFTAPITSAPLVNLGLSSATAAEGDSSVITITGQATTPVTDDQTVDLELSLLGMDSTDFEISGTSLLIPDGQTTASITFTVTDDSHVELNESLILTLVNPSHGISLGPRSSRTITVVDDEIVGITVVESAGETIVTEGPGVGQSDTFTVVLNDQPASNVVFDVLLSPNPDAAIDRASITFTNTNWDQPQFVTVVGLDDDVVDGDEISTVTISVNDATTDDAFDTLPDHTLTVTTTDDDVAGFTLNETTVTVSEDGTITDSFHVSLDAQPIRDVVLDVTLSSDPNAVIDKTSLTFTNANWNHAQIITVTGLDDDTDDGDETTTLTFSINALVSDDIFDLLPDQTVVVTTTDDETVGVTVSTISDNTTESVGTASFTVELDSEPTADVMIGLISSDTTEGTIDLSAITFTPDNWNSPQTVTVTGVDDEIDDGDVEFSIVTVPATGGDYADFNPPDVIVINSDDDTRGVTISAISGRTTEAGGTATFTVVLDTEPTADVMIGLTSSDSTESTVDLSAITFTPDNWNSPQTVTVTGVDDDIDDGDVEFSIVTAAATGGDYGDINPPDVAVINIDDDTRNVTVSAISGNTTEAGGAATFTVVLESEPTADVMIELTSSDTTEGTADLSAITFTPDNWNTPQIVPVTGVDDEVDDGDVEFSIVTAAATGGDYADLDPPDVHVINIDDDRRGVTVSGISGNTTEAGGTATFTVVLDSEPTADVMITVTSSDLTEGTIEVSEISFTPDNWNTPQTVTVTGVDDNIDDDDIDYSIITATATGGDYVDIDPNDVDVINIDNDTSELAVTINVTSISETDGSNAATGTVFRNLDTSAPLTVALTSSDTSEAIVPATVTIPAGQGKTTFNIIAVNDFELDGNKTVTINASVDGFVSGEGALMVTDDEPGQLDVDEDIRANATTDGILVIRYLFGFTGDSLVNHAVGTDANLRTGSEIAAKLANSEAILDADGDGAFNATTDGILVMRHLFGFTGNALVDNAIGAEATRNTGEAVQTYLDSFLPSSPNSNSGSFSGVTDTGGSLKMQSFGLATETPLFTWELVSQASDYRIQIVNLETNATVHSNLTTSNRFTADPFHQGRYRIWVSAISGDSKKIVSSGWQEFTIATAEESYSPFTAELTTDLMAIEGGRAAGSTLLPAENDDSLPGKVDSTDEHMIDQIMTNALTKSPFDDTDVTPAATDD